MPLTCRQFRRRRGFTLVELMTSVAALALLLLGVTSIFIMMLRMAASVANSTGVSLDASNAAQRVIENLREAQDFVPVDSSRRPVTAGTSGSGLYIFFPNSYQTVTVGRGNSATQTLPGTGVSALYDTSGYAGSLYIYRSDTSGNPNAAGACLWIQGTENGVTVPSSTVNGATVPGHALLKTLDPASSTAVQFSVPMDTTASPKQIPYQVQVRITCSTADTLHAQTTSDSAAGGTVKMTGECVQIRNHGSAPGKFTGVLPLP